MDRQPECAAAVLGYVGPVGDHNDAPVDSVPALTNLVAAATARRARLFGKPFESIEQSSAEHLEQARPLLAEYADAVGEQVRAGHRLICVNGRCAASLATVPQVLQTHPGTVLVWLDAHADLNLPQDSPTDYLGGMAVSGPLGWWDTGLGAGLNPDGVVLVGARAIDDAEARLIERHDIPVLAPQRSEASALVDIVAGRPVFFHIDCDVLQPGLFRTDYREPDGLTLAQVAELAAGLADSASPIVGVEIAEWEGPGSEQAQDLLDALAPLL